MRDPAKVRANEVRRNAKRRERRKNDPEWRARRDAELRDWIVNKGGKERQRVRERERRIYDPAYREAVNAANRARRMKTEYGLTLAEVAALRAQQDNRCKLCRIEFVLPTGHDRRRTVTRSAPHIDHDHNTGHVRGVLCMGCNVALGVLGDDAVGLARALAYVQGTFVETIDEHY